MTGKTFIRRPRAARIGLVSVLGLACCGCWRPPGATVQQLDRGLVYLFPGIESGPWSFKGVHEAFRDVGVDAAIRSYEWPVHSSGLGNLTAYDRNRAEAGRIAEEIVRYHDDHPGRPIDLIGYSGGGGMAVMVAEALPDDLRLRHVILVQPALSRDYDLTRATQRVGGKVVNFHSPRDWLILGLGTTAFGNMDRQYGPAAGKDGFEVAAALPDESLRTHFEQRCWTPDMAAQGHGGGHLEIVRADWNRAHIAPYLRSGPDPTASATELTGGGDMRLASAP